jgi:hypothetical protein
MIGLAHHRIMVAERIIQELEASRPAFAFQAQYAVLEGPAHIA